MSHTDSLLAQSPEPRGRQEFTGIKSERRVLIRLVWD